jgi:hypothetical protein
MKLTKGKINKLYKKKKQSVKRSKPRDGSKYNTATFRNKRPLDLQTKTLKQTGRIYKQQIVKLQQQIGGDKSFSDALARAWKSGPDISGRMSSWSWSNPASTSSSWNLGVNAFSFFKDKGYGNWVKGQIFSTSRKMADDIMEKLNAKVISSIPEGTADQVKEEKNVEVTAQPVQETRQTVKVTAQKIEEGTEVTGVEVIGENVEGTEVEIDEETEDEKHVKQQETIIKPEKMFVESSLAYYKQKETTLTKDTKQLYNEIFDLSKKISTFVDGKAGLLDENKKKIIKKLLDIRQLTSYLSGSIIKSFDSLYITAYPTYKTTFAIKGTNAQSGGTVPEDFKNSFKNSFIDNLNNVFNTLPVKIKNKMDGDEKVNEKLKDEFIDAYITSVYESQQIPSISEEEKEVMKKTLTETETEYFKSLDEEIKKMNPEDMNPNDKTTLLESIQALQKQYQTEHLDAKETSEKTVADAKETSEKTVADANETVENGEEARKEGIEKVDAEKDQKNTGTVGEEEDKKETSEGATVVESKEGTSENKDDTKEQTDILKKIQDKIKNFNKNKKKDDYDVLHMSLDSTPMTNDDSIYDKKNRFQTKLMLLLLENKRVKVTLKKKAPIVLTEGIIQPPIIESVIISLNTTKKPEYNEVKTDKVDDYILIDNIVKKIGKTTLTNYKFKIFVNIDTILPNDIKIPDSLPKSFIYKSDESIPDINPIVTEALKQKKWTSRDGKKTETLYNFTPPNDNLNGDTNNNFIIIDDDILNSKTFYLPFLCIYTKENSYRIETIEEDTSAPPASDSSSTKDAPPAPASDSSSTKDAPPASSSSTDSSSVSSSSSSSTDPASTDVFVDPNFEPLLQSYDETKINSFIENNGIKNDLQKQIIHLLLDNKQFDIKTLKEDTKYSIQINPTSYAAVEINSITDYIVPNVEENNTDSQVKEIVNSHADASDTEETSENPAAASAPASDTENPVKAPAFETETENSADAPASETKNPVKTGGTLPPAPASVDASVDAPVDAPSETPVAASETPVDAPSENPAPASETPTISTQETPTTSTQETPNPIPASDSVKPSTDAPSENTEFKIFVKTVADDSVEGYILFNKTDKSPNIFFNETPTPDTEEVVAPEEVVDTKEVDTKEVDPKKVVAPEVAPEKRYAPQIGGTVDDEILEVSNIIFLKPADIISVSESIEKISVTGNQPLGKYDPTIFYTQDDTKKYENLKNIRNDVTVKLKTTFIYAHIIPEQYKIELLEATGVVVEDKIAENMKTFIDDYNKKIKEYIVKRHIIADLGSSLPYGGVPINKKTISEDPNDANSYLLEGNGINEGYIYPIGPGLLHYLSMRSAAIEFVEYAIADAFYEKYQEVKKSLLEQIKQLQNSITDTNAVETQRLINQLQKKLKEYEDKYGRGFTTWYNRSFGTGTNSGTNSGTGTVAKSDKKLKQNSDDDSEDEEGDVNVDNSASKDALDTAVDEVTNNPGKYIIPKEPYGIVYYKLLQAITAVIDERMGNTSSDAQNATKAVEKSIEAQASASNPGSTTPGSKTNKTGNVPENYKEAETTTTDISSVIDENNKGPISSRMPISTDDYETLIKTEILIPEKLKNNTKLSNKRDECLEQKATLTTSKQALEDAKTTLNEENNEANTTAMKTAQSNYDEKKSSYLNCVTEFKTMIKNSDKPSGEPNSDNDDDEELLKKEFTIPETMSD